MYERSQYCSDKRFTREVLDFGRGRWGDKEKQPHDLSLQSFPLSPCPLVPLSPCPAITKNLLTETYCERSRWLMKLKSDRSILNCFTRFELFNAEITFYTLFCLRELILMPNFLVIVSITLASSDVVIPSN